MLILAVSTLLWELYSALTAWLIQTPCCAPPVSQTLHSARTASHSGSLSSQIKDASFPALSIIYLGVLSSALIPYISNSLRLSKFAVLTTTPGLLFPLRTVACYLLSFSQSRDSSSRPSKACSILRGILSGTKHKWQCTEAISQTNH